MSPTSTHTIDLALYEHLEPTANKVFVVRDPVKEGLLHLPDAAREREHHLISTGTVVAAGPGKFDLMGNRIPMQCKVGDRVALQPGMHGDIEVDGDKLVVTEDHLLVAIIHPRKIRFTGKPIDVEAAPEDTDAPSI